MKVLVLLVVANFVVLLVVVTLAKPVLAFTTYDSRCFRRSGTIRCRLPTSFQRPLLPQDPKSKMILGRHTTSAIHAEGKKDSVTYDGSGRGRYILVLVLFICIWQFSIPTSFRRARFCPTACVKERTLCRTPCVTFEEWTSDIVQYYKDGGGIQWDFSIDPKTLNENEQFIQNLFGTK